VGEDKSTLGPAGTKCSDHFSALAGTYSAYRPLYPASLFSELASQVKRRDMAWDCGCGGGQASRDLAKYFATVVATDLSMAQLRSGGALANLAFVASRAESVPLAHNSVDLVTVAQALHWFDLRRFYREVRRVLRPGGRIAVWSYARMRITPTIDQIIDHFCDHTVGPYWPPERRYVEARYENLPFPFDPQPFAAQEMLVWWGLDQVMGYLRSWSASQRYREHRGSEPFEIIEMRLRSAWGGPAERMVSWPLTVKLGKV
jgi:SAM-dependent methyltransferase